MSISCAWTTLWAEALAISCDSHVKDQMPEKWQGVASFLLEWLGWSMVNCLDWISSGSVMNFHPSSLKVLIFSSWFYWQTPQIDEIEQRAEISGSGQTSCLGLFFDQDEPAQNRGLRILQVYCFSRRDGNIVFSCKWLCGIAFLRGQVKHKFCHFEFAQRQKKLRLVQCSWFGWFRPIAHRKFRQNWQQKRKAQWCGTFYLQFIWFESIWI